MDQISTAVDLPPKDQGLKCCREKYWDEKTPDEKIRQLGEAVEYLQRQVLEQSEIINLFTAHSHLLNGDIVTKLSAGTPAVPYYMKNPLGRGPQTTGFGTQG